MPELTLQNIELIAKDMRRQDVNYSHLLDELIDHVCCDIENEMDKGLTFNEAYRLVMQRIAPGRFREIQKETLFAVDSKYRFMKNTMKISGIAGTLMFGIAALFKIQHWPGAGIMMTLGAFILAFIFLPSALGVMWKETHNRNRIFLLSSSFLTGFFFITGTLFKVQHWPMAGIILTLSAFTIVVLFVPSLLTFLFRDPEKKSFRPVYIVAAAGFVLYVTGFLFKIQHWPMATTLIMAGLFLAGYISIPWYTSKTFRDETFVSARFLFLIIAFVIIIIPGTIINLNMQSSYEEGYYINQEKQLALQDYFLAHNRQLIGNVHDTAKYSQVMNIHSATRNMLGIVSSIQAKMVQESGEKDQETAQSRQVVNSEGGVKIMYNEIRNPFAAFPVKDFLLPGSQSRKDIESGMDTFLKEISSYIPGEKLKEYKSLLDPAIFFPWKPDVINVSLMSGLHSLELLKNSILAIESGAANIIVNQ